MTCADHPSFWRRAWRAGISDPRSILLGIFGLAAFVIGILVADGAMGVALIVVGSAILCLGVLLPTVQEAQIGTSGFTFKRTMQVRDDSFKTFVEAQQESLQRLAVMVTGDVAAAATLVEDALAQAYSEWNFVSSERRIFYLVCRAIGRALGALRIGAAVPNPDEVPAGMRPLLAIGAQARAVTLLHHYQGFADADIARIIGVTAEDVRSLLARADEERQKYTESSVLPPGTGTTTPDLPPASETVEPPEDSP